MSKVIPEICRSRVGVLEGLTEVGLRCSSGVVGWIETALQNAIEHELEVPYIPLRYIRLCSTCD